MVQSMVQLGVARRSRPTHEDARGGGTMRVLLVEDEAPLRGALRRAFWKRGFEVTEAASVSEARAALDRVENVAVALIDLRLDPKNPGDRSGLDLVRWLRATHGPPAIVHTGCSDPDLGAVCRGAGAELVVEKGRQDTDALADLLRALVERSPSPPPVSDGLIGSSRAMAVLRTRIRQVAQRPEPVLLIGETGVGKNCVARAIHAASGLGGELSELDLGTLSPSTFEDALFGHERGAFTGADEMRPGPFEVAANGTILLDEIGTVPLALQPRLLRVLQERKVRRMGSSRDLDVRARVVAATNIELSREVERGAFRGDLLYRLAVYQLYVPPLRERREDVRELATAFAARRSRALAEDVVQWLASRDYPGNVRQLERDVARLVTFDAAHDVAAAQAALAESDSARPSSPRGLGVADGPTRQRARASEALTAAEGNQSQAAKRLGVHRNTLARWLRDEGD